MVEAYFNRMEFSAEDLQTIIKAAHNVERIMFNWCCIHCMLELDFGENLNYKTKLLSFQQWGDNDLKERTTDWKIEPSCFVNIVNAIGASGLRSSLQKVNIGWNQTLSLSKVKMMFKARSMSNISVVENYASLCLP